MRIARVRPRGRAARALAAALADGIRARPRPPCGVRELCHALCAEMSARRGGRPVGLRFECFPDEIEVTGLWIQFHDRDLVIVEERAEEMQQLVILGHELWHMHAGHGHRHDAGRAVADRTLTGEPGWRDSALRVAARDGSREADEADADAFGHRLAAVLRPYLAGGGAPPPGPVQRAMGYLGGRGGAE